MKCERCDGHGLVEDYGPFGLDFYGAKECPDCKGSGQKLKKRKEFPNEYESR